MQMDAYYAGPGNKFYSILFKIGLTPYSLDPQEYPKLLDFRIGITDLVKTQFGSDSSLSNQAFNVSGFISKLEKYKPTVVAFNGKKSAAWALGLNGNTKKIGYGLFTERLAGIRVFILPSTSGAANAFWDEEYWFELMKVIEDQ